MRVKIDLLSYCFDTLINLLGITFNSVLLYIVWRHTPRKMHTYSVLIVNTIIADFTIAFCGFLTSNRIIPSGEAIVFVSNGPCVRLGSRACLVIYETLLHALEHGLMSQFISFSYRYYILVSTRIPRRRQLAAICLAVYAPSFLLYCIHIGHYDDPELLKSMAMKYHPTYNFTGYTVSGHYPFTETTTLLTILYLLVPNIPLYILIAVLRRKTLRILKDTSIKLKKSNRKIHIQLMKVLTLQSYTPLFLIAMMLMYFVGQFQLFNHPVLEYLTQTVTAFLPLCNPVISLTYITPYRRAFSKWFRPVTQQYSITRAYPSRTATFSDADSASQSLKTIV
ncbi:hypothetical protein Y032_0579g242 [Ancylostoma ceylanicum]|nr:hypothetical protein Y032_0579g242 [Ancylostoma ceylanicum]